MHADHPSIVGDGEVTDNLIAGIDIAKDWLGICVFVGVRERCDGLRFAMTAVFFLAAFLSLAVMFWP